MTWVCSDTFIFAPADGDDDIHPQPAFLDEWWRRQNPCNRFNITGLIYHNAEGHDVDNLRDHEEPHYCSEHGEEGIWLVELQLVRFQAGLALDAGWLLCLHGDGRNPVLLDCEDCLETHTLNPHHTNLPNLQIVNNAELADAIEATELNQVRPRPAPRLPATITDGAGRILDLDIHRGEYVARRRPPRTLHVVTGGRDGR